jgi:serine/threonine protein kinase/Tol biopolymer transport system component
MAFTDQVITGRYRLGRLLGSGGFGAVYLAEDLRLQRTVAIKICSTRSLPPNEAEEAARLFQSEALTLARLRHPGLTAVWDYFSQDDEWFLVMEYVPGQTLREVLKQVNGRLPVNEAIDYASQLCEVLRYLHGQPHPIVFRDLKPGNIMVTPNGELKLIDFGIARLFSPGKITDTAQFGTPGYAPPEQYGGQTSPRSDIYSLGAVVHQMMTGHNPATSPFALPPARLVNPALSPEIEAALARAVAPRPEDRFASVGEFCAALRAHFDASVTGPTIQVSTPRSTTLHTSRTEPSSRPLWTPAPRMLPQPPSQGGVARGLALLVLVFALFAGAGWGIWSVRDQLRSLWSMTYAAPRPGQGVPVEGMVAYVAPAPDGVDNLFVRMGTTIRQITQLPTGTSAALPAISPDRTRIAYVEHNNGIETLWLIDADGSNRRPLLAQYALSRSPSWSPDGTQLLAEVARDGDAWMQHDIVLLDLASGNVRELTSSSSWEGAPDWSPDGGRIAFSGRLDGSRCMRVYILDVDGGTPAEATQPPSPEECTSANGDFWPTWSPDGTQLAFGRKYEDAERVAIMDVATGTIDVWNTGPSAAGHPQWSPSGRAILFEEDTADGKQLVRLTLSTKKIDILDPNRPGALADWR